MSLYIASLNSGSNGNCYYISNGRHAVLIDAGLSCRETEKRMQRLNLSMKNVRAIFISHEHTDHIKGVPVLSKKYSLPVYITERTLQYSRLYLDKDTVKPFRTDEAVEISGLKVIPFSKQHDAVDPHSFVVDGNGVRIGVFTDLGISCDNLIYHFKTCHAAFLEANYDATMLEYGRYPIHLKNRIRGGKGHLSNEQALNLFRFHRPGHLSHLFLSHLSQDNNNPELVTKLFNEHAGEVQVVVASRHMETAVYHIKNQRSTFRETADSSIHYQNATQATLF